jgi:hypothetical protein
LVEVFGKQKSSQSQKCLKKTKDKTKKVNYNRFTPLSEGEGLGVRIKNKKIMKKLTLKTATMKQLKTNIITAITAVFLFLPSFGGVGGGWGLYAQVPGTPYIVPSYYEEETGFCPLGSTTDGTEFWTTFGQNGNAFSLQPSETYLALKIAVQEETDVTLTFMDNYDYILNNGSTKPGNIATYHIPSGTVYEISMSNIQGNVAPNNINLGDMRPNVFIANNNISLKTLHIESIKPISVYAFNTGNAVTDATLVMPTAIWGTDYYGLSYTPLNFQDTTSFEIIIAKEANTLLYLNGSMTPFATLNAGEAYATTSIGFLAEDFTGRHITSSAPVAYFTHLTYTNIPVGQSASDILFEQLAPVNQWGTQFLIPSAPNGRILPSISMQNRIRIVASEPATRVEWDTSSAVRRSVPSGQNIDSGGFLNAGQWVELEFITPLALIPGDAGACYIKTDKPVGVAAYMPGCGNNIPFSEADAPLGDPAISRIPSLEQLTPELLISPFLFDPSAPDNPNTLLDKLSSVHYMMIITPTAAKGQTVVTMDNGATVIDITENGANPWYDNIASGTIGDTKYSYIRYKFDNVAHYGKSFKVRNPRGIMILVGGVDSAESYYYNAGSGACELR